MLRLKILNSKDIKRIMELVELQWGAKLKPDYAFLINSKNRIYAVNREVGSIPFEQLRINSMGLYFGELLDETIRLSIEGSQIIGPHATKNVVDISDDEMARWLRGEDLGRDSGSNGFVIIRHGDDFLGTGRHSNGVIKNFVPKTRRIKSSD